MRRSGLILCTTLAACGGHHHAVEQANPPPAPDAAVAAPEVDAAAPAATVETWAATIILPTSLYDVVFHFTRPAGQPDAAWQATLDAPAAGISGYGLADVDYTASRIAFTVQKPTPPDTWEHFQLARSPDGAAAQGIVLIGGAPFNVKMARLGAGEAPRSVVVRAQTPKPPFPYGARDVVVDAPAGGKLAGTLTIPSGKGPFPAVLLISGSGQEDRDETIFGHKPFLVLADRLTRAGFVVLRLDDRMTGQTQGKLGTLDTDIDDADAAFTFLGQQGEVDASRVGLIGHSVGGAIAPIVAARHTRKQPVAFIVLLAGMTVPGVDLIPMQLEADLKARGAPADTVAGAVAMQRKVGAAIVKGNPAGLKKAARDVIEDSYRLAGKPAPTGAELDKAVADKVAEISNPATQTFFRVDPRKTWRKLKVPVLALVGTKDTQVPAKANLDALTTAARAAGNKDVTAHTVDGVNHLFQHADTGVLDEYALIDETFDPATLDEITTWLTAKAHIPPDPRFTDPVR